MLYTLVHQTSNSKLITELLMEWKEGVSVSDLLNELHDRINITWKNEKRKTKKVRLKFDDFKMAITKELRNKGIAKEHIDYIEKKLRDR